MLTLGFYTYLENKSSTTNISFLILCICVFIWLSGYSLFISTGKDNLALIIYKYYEFIGLLFITPSLFLMTISFLKLLKVKKYLYISIINYLVMIIFLIISAVTNRMIVGLKEFTWGRDILYGSLSIYMTIALILILFESIYLYIYYYYKASNEDEKIQIRFFIISIGVASLAVVNFLSSFGINFYPIGYIPIFICFVIQSYAITKYGDIKVYKLLANTPNGVLVINRIGHITLANNSSDILTGIKLSDMSGKRVDELYHNKELKVFYDIYNNLSEGNFNKFEKEQFFSVSNKYVLIRVSPIKSRFGEISHLEVVLTDITKQKLLEDKLNKYSENLETAIRERTSELEDAKQKITQAYEELRSLDELKSNIIANVSHELNTPLAIIKGSIELIKEVKDTKERENIINISTEAVNKQEGIIKNLLEAVKLEKNTNNIDIRDVDIAKLIEDVLAEFSVLILKKDLSVNIDIDEELPLIKGDYNGLGSVIRNLLSNAIKFNKNGGFITITSHIKSNIVETCVVDSGIGIEASKLEFIFDRFYQVDSSSIRKYNGVGLGLFLVKRIVESHKGRITVISEPGKGSTFCFYLPVKPI